MPRMRHLLLVLALLLPACEKRDRDSGDQPPQQEPPPAPAIDAAPPAPPADPRAEARRKTVEFIEDLARAIDQTGGDCAAMTLAVKAVVDRNGDLVDVVRRVRARGDSAARQKEPAQVEFHETLKGEYGPRIVEAQRKIAGADACIPQSPQLAEMLGEMGKKPPPSR